MKKSVVVKDVVLFVEEEKFDDAGWWILLGGFVLVPHLLKGRS